MTASTKKNAWDGFAHEDPYWYITMNYTGDQEAFWRDGKEGADNILSRVKSLLPATNTVLEIGCGVGRVLIPISSHFKTAIGIDISPRMLELLDEHAHDFGANERITGSLPDQNWNVQNVDLAYSVIVFQHIDDFAAIKNYIMNVANVLRTDGIAYFQFNTTPITIPYKIRQLLPDYVLPKQWKRGARTIRRNPLDLQRVFAFYDLNIIEEFNLNSGLHTYILQRK